MVVTRPEPAADRAAITLCLCGDVMTGRGLDQILPHPCSPELFERAVKDAREYVDIAERARGAIRRPVDFAYPWGAALPTLRSADVRIVNLETAVTADGLPWSHKEVHYRMHPGNVRCLTVPPIDVCTVANNHALDWGRDALLETLDTLHQAGIATAGAGPTLGHAHQPVFVEGPHWRVSVLGLASTSSGVPPTWAATEERPGVWLLEGHSERDADAVGDILARSKRIGDIVVASVHWGSNWGYEVTDEQVSFAHALVDRGVDVVHGHSSHHPRPIERHRGKLVLYGCGDFLNDYEGIRGLEAFRSDLVLAYLPTVDVATGELLELRMAPYCTRRMRLERATPEDAAWLADALSRIGHAHGTHAAVDHGWLTLTDTAARTSQDRS